MYIGDKILFQQEGAPPQYAIALSDYLNETYHGR